MEVKKYIEELREKIRYHADKYYNQDQPEISDYEYDMLLQELKILETTYKNTEYSQEELNEMIANDYPFKIEFNIDTENLKAINGSGIFTVNVTWPYESGNDELDTIWGANSYDYKQKFPDTPGIVIKLKLTVSQIKNS